MQPDMQPPYQTHGGNHGCKQYEGTGPRSHAATGRGHAYTRDGCRSGHLLTPSRPRKEGRLHSSPIVSPASDNVGTGSHTRIATRISGRRVRRTRHCIRRRASPHLLTLVLSLAWSLSNGNTKGFCGHLHTSQMVNTFREHPTSWNALARTLGGANVRGANCLHEGLALPP